MKGVAKIVKIAEDADIMVSITKRKKLEYKTPKILKSKFKHTRIAYKTPEILRRKFNHKEIEYKTPETIRCSGDYVINHNKTTYKTPEILRHYPGNEKQELISYFGGFIQTPIQYVYRKCCICGFMRFSDAEWGNVTNIMVMRGSSSKLHCGSESCCEIWYKHTIGAIDCRFPKDFKM